MLFTGGDEAPWITCRSAASLVLVVALSAREVLMRRAWTRYLLEHGGSEQPTRSASGNGVFRKRAYSATSLTAALRAIQKQSAEADAGSRPESHLDVVHFAMNFISRADEAFVLTGFHGRETQYLSSGTRARPIMEKHHLLTWARQSSVAFTHEAQNARACRIRSKQLIALSIASTLP